MLYAGYVEDSTLGCLVLWHPEGFDTVEDALQDLAVAFKEVVERETKQAHDRASHWNEVCPHCDKPLVPGDPDDVTEDEIADLIREKITSVLNDSGPLWDVLMDDHGWNPTVWDMPRTMMRDMIIVRENADTLLAEIACEEYGGIDWEQAVVRPEGLQMYRPETEV